MNGGESADVAHSPALSHPTTCPILEILLGSQLQGPHLPLKAKAQGEVGGTGVLDAQIRAGGVSVPGAQGAECGPVCPGGAAPSIFTYAG